MKGNYGQTRYSTNYMGCMLLYCNVTIRSMLLFIIGIRKEIMNETKGFERNMSLKLDDKQYEKLRKASYESKKSIAQIIREAIDEKLGK